MKEEPGVGPIENRERVFIDLTVENNDDDNDDEEQRSAERPVEFERDESSSGSSDSPIEDMTNTDENDSDADDDLNDETLSPEEKVAKMLVNH